MGKPAISQALSGVGDAITEMLVDPYLKLLKERYDTVLAVLERHPEIIQKSANALEALQTVAALAGLNYAYELEATVTGSFQEDTAMGGGLKFSLGTSLLAAAVAAEYERRTVSAATATIRAITRIDNGGTVGIKYLESMSAPDLVPLMTERRDYVAGRLSEQATPEPSEG